MDQKKKDDILVAISTQQGLKEPTEFEAQLGIAEEYNKVNRNKYWDSAARKEVNKKYAYRIDLYSFASSANKVSAACADELNSSDFLKKHFSDIKAQVVSEIHRITGV